MLRVIDEFTRRCLAIVVARRLRSDDVLQCLTELFVVHGPPQHIRSDNGPELAARAVRLWLGRVGVKTLFIEPGSPWENGYCESFNSKLRDELLNSEIFTTLSRSPGADRELAPPLQRRQAPLVARIPTARTGSCLAATLRAALRSASVNPRVDQGGRTLTHELVPLQGAGWSRSEPTLVTSWATMR